MKLQFNQDIELWVVGFGVHQPKKIVEVNKEMGKMMIETGYFDEIKEKEIKVKIKKSKKKDYDKNISQ